MVISSPATTKAIRKHRDRPTGTYATAARRRQHRFQLPRPPPTDPASPPRGAGTNRRSALDGRAAFHGLTEIRTESTARSSGRGRHNAERFAVRAGPLPSLRRRGSGRTKGQARPPDQRAGRRTLPRSGRSRSSCARRVGFRQVQRSNRDLERDPLTSRLQHLYCGGLSGDRDCATSFPLGLLGNLHALSRSCLAAVASRSRHCSLSFRHVR